MPEVLRMHPLIDMHVHMRDPGQEYKEDFYTGTSAALAGGVIFVADMPNNVDLIDSIDRLRHKQEIAQRKVVSDIGMYAGTMGEPDQDLEAMIPYALGLKMYLNPTTGHFFLPSRKEVRTGMRKWESDKPVLAHAEGEKTKEVIEEARDAGRNIHICHVSEAQQITWIREAKMKWGPEHVTAEVTPQHLIFTKFWSLDPGKQLKPEFGTPGDVAMLWEAVRDGTIDVIATDHAPHTKEEKAAPKPPSGVTGLETTLPILLRFQDIGWLTAEQIESLTYRNPMRILNLPEQPNSHILVRRGEQYRVDPSTFKSHCHTSPVEGVVLDSKVVETVLRGETLYQEGTVLAKQGSGRVWLKAE